MKKHKVNLSELPAKEDFPHPKFVTKELLAALAVSHSRMGSFKATNPKEVENAIFGVKAIKKALEAERKKLKKTQKKLLKSLPTKGKILTDPIDILDCLGGNPSGDYAKDLKAARKNFGVEFEEVDYYQAISMLEQP